LKGAAASEIRGGRKGPTIGGSLRLKRPAVNGRVWLLLKTAVALVVIFGVTDVAKAATLLGRSAKE
jgi:hypothetical protein